MYILIFTIKKVDGDSIVVDSTKRKKNSYQCIKIQLIFTLSYLFIESTSNILKLLFAKLDVMAQI